MLFSAMFMDALRYAEWGRKFLGCWQSSISAFYFTTAHSIFVAALCAVGACLIMYKGSGIEDTILNFSGFLSFLVAMVPTYRSPEGTCIGAMLQPDGTSVFRNVYAIYVLAAAAMGIGEFLRRKALQQRGSTAEAETERQQSNAEARSDWAAGIVPIIAGAALLVWIVISDVVGDPPAGELEGLQKLHFLRAGHNVVAVTMFLGLAAVMGLNALAARTPGDPRSRFRSRYAIAFLAMFMSLLATVALPLLFDNFEHLILWLEMAVLVPFAAFWAIQTQALWFEVAPPPAPLPPALTKALRQAA